MEFNHDSNNVLEAVGISQEDLEIARDLVEKTVEKSDSFSRLIEAVLEHMKADDRQARAVILLLINELHRVLMEKKLKSALVRSIITGAITGKDEDGEPLPLCELAKALSDGHEVDPEKCVQCDEREDCPLFAEMMDKNTSKAGGTIH